MIHHTLHIMLFCFLFFSCQSKTEHYVPKPKGFNRIDLPIQKYQVLPAGYPYRFEYNQAAVIKKDTFSKAEPYWIMVYYPRFDAMIQLTYKPTLGDTKRLQAIINDSYNLTSKHNVRAYDIEEKIMTTADGKKAILLELTGDVPSQLQFFTTDTTKHYLRGALYFKTATANDSLAPVIRYIKEDCLHLLTSLSWQK